MEAKQHESLRNRRMDVYRGIAIYGVVFIHVLFPGFLGDWVRALARFAVPFFFLTAGYFSWNAAPHRLLSHAARTFRILLLSCVPYALLGMVLAHSRGEGAWAFLFSCFSWPNFRDFILFQTVPFPYAWQLWFLGALAGTYLLWWLLTALYRSRGRLLPYDRLAVAALVLLALHLIAGEVSALMGAEMDNRLLRSIPLDALPFFALGGWFACRRQEVKESTVPWHYLILGGGVLSLLESALAGRQELYLGSVLVLAGLMGRAIRYRNISESRASRFLQLCGQRLTLSIYIGHLLVLALIREAPILGWLNHLTWILPIIVAVLSTLLALGWGVFKDLFISRRNAIHENHRRTPAPVSVGREDEPDGPESGA